MNSEEPGETLMEIYSGERRGTYLIHCAMEGHRGFSGPVQVDAAAGVEEADEFGRGGVQRCRCVAKKKG